MTSPSPHLSLSMSSRSHFCPMSTEWITCRWMRRRLKRCKTPKWSGRMSGSQKHKIKICNEENQEHLVLRRPTTTPARATYMNTKNYFKALQKKIRAHKKVSRYPISKGWKSTIKTELTLIKSVL